VSQSDPRLPWTDEQVARVNQVIQEEASRARVAATFLPLYGPLSPDSDFVRAEQVREGPPPGGVKPRITIEDTTTLKLSTLQVKVYLRGAQMADPGLKSALQVFRRAANVLARCEDAVSFRGQPDDQGTLPPGVPDVCEILGGQQTDGLHGTAVAAGNVVAVVGLPGDGLVTAVSEAIGQLEAKGQFGPFAAVLGQDLFVEAQTPNDSLVLPQDRIVPFLGGGSLLRSSTLPANNGVIVALGGAPVELVVATDMSLNFLQITPDPMFVFRVFEKLVLRIKQRDAIMVLERAPGDGAARVRESRRGQVRRTSRRRNSK
jgi:hypothetical protein